MRIKAIINPISGKNDMRQVVQEACIMLEERGFLRSEDIYYTSKDGNVAGDLFENCDVVAVAGGDGTLHSVINSMKNHGCDKPIAYLPCGTMNDFGNCMQLPRAPREFCDMLEGMELKKIDLGLTDGRYFHYSVSGGGFCTISHTTNQRLKNFLGKSAYYLAALVKFSRIFRGTHIKVECAELTTDENAILYLASNSPIAGGFKNLLPGARIDDGYLHVLILRKCSLLKAFKLFRQINKGTHFSNPNVLYIKTKRVKITQTDNSKLMTDIDGEYGSSLIIDAVIIPEGVTMLVPKAN